MSLVRTTDLAGGYVPGRDAIEAVSFALEAGEMAGILGPNGGGKTTLFRALLGELPQRRGTVELAGSPAYVPQTDHARLDFPVSALDVALMGAYRRTPFYRRIGRTERATAERALERVGLAEHAKARFGTLSGGQRQRVLIARALVQDADVLLLDEPFSGLDDRSAERLMELIDDLAREGRAVLVATHDMDQTRAWDRVLCLNVRQVAFGPPGVVLTREVVERTYGGSIVVLPAAGQASAAAVLPAHHHAHDD